MREDISKKAKYILWVLGGACVLFTVLYYVEVVDEDFMLSFAYILLGITGITAIVFPIVILAQDPKQAKGTVVALVGLLIVFGLGYVFATDALVLTYEKYDVNAFTSKGVGMGLIGTYILMALSFGGIVFFGIMSLIKG